MAKIRGLIFYRIKTAVVAFLRAGRLFARVFVSLKHRRWLSDPVVLLLGALIGLAVGFFALRGFIFSPGLMFYSDDLIWQYSSHVYPMHYLWDEFKQAPVVINHMLGYLTVYSFPAEIGERFLFLEIFTMMGLSMFYSSFKLTYNHHKTARVPLLVATLATLIFILNPIVAQWIDAWYNLWWYAFLPLLLYFSYSTFNNILTMSKWEFIKKAVIISLILFIMSVSPRMPYYFLLLPLAFLAGSHRPFVNYFYRSCLFVILLMMLYAVFCAVWLVPMAMGSGTGPEYIASRWMPYNFCKNASLFKVFTLRFNYNAIDFLVRYSVPESILPFVKAALIAVPIIAFSAILFRRSKLIIWLVIFALALIFMGKGTQPPFGSFYEWFVFDAPVISAFGWEFRTSNLWLILLASCYSVLIALIVSHFLGWVKNRINSVWIVRGIFTVTLVILLAIPFGTGYPLLTGNLHKGMRIINAPDYFIDFSNWIGMEAPDSKVFYYPAPEDFGSPTPSQPVGPRMEPSRVPLGFFYIIESIGDTKNLGKLIAPFNAKYVVDRYWWGGEEKREWIRSALEQQEDLTFVQKFKEGMYVYKNMEQCSQIEVSSHSVGVMGGLENMLSLAAIDTYDPVRFPVIFLDQQESCSDYLESSDIIVSNLDSLDLYMSLVDEEYMVKPHYFINDNPDSDWYIKSADLTGSLWFRQLKSAGMENWQYDFAAGLAQSPGPTTMDMPFSVNHSGLYDILVRCFQNAGGHSGIRVLLDGELAGNVQTQAQTNEIVWKEVGLFTLEKGGHTLTLENIRGFQGVNLFAILPHGQLEGYEQRVNEKINDKQIISIWEAETALNFSSANVFEDYGANASNGEVRMLLSGSRIWRDIDILKDGHYTMAVGLDGSAVVNIDGEAFSVSSNGLGFSYIDQVVLTKGKHSIEITNQGGQSCAVDVVWLYSVDDEGETVEDIFSSGESHANVISYEKIDPTKYLVTVQADEPFILEFAESYNEFWQANVNGKSYASVPINSIVNGFWIDDHGELEITIEYKLQRAFYIGAVISGVGIIGALGFFVWLWIKRRRQKSIIT